MLGMKDVKKNNVIVVLLIVLLTMIIGVGLSYAFFSARISGTEATIYVYNEGEKDYVKTFAGLTKRDGQFIISRNRIDNFTLNDLKNKEVLAGRAGGMPIINFKNALKNENIKDVNINSSVDFANLTSAFISGMGDFVNLFEIIYK